MLGNWLEVYAQTMEINNWTNTELGSATYDESEARWTAVLRNNDGTERTVRPRHLIFANGLVGSQACLICQGSKTLKAK